MGNSSASNEHPDVSQKELFKQKFLEIKKDVTKEDRTLCSKHEKLSKITVDRYVNGHIYDNDTAYKIYTFLKKRIDKRARALK